MRKPLTSLLILLCVVMTAQERIHLESNDIASYIDDENRIPKVGGKLLNYSVEKYPELNVRYSISSPNYRKQEANSAVIQADGSFSLSFSKSFPYREIWVSVGELYHGKLLANTDLEIILDLEIISELPVNFYGDGITFTGTDAESAKFINEYELYKVDRKKELEDEKLAVVFDHSLSKIEKVEKIKKTYKKLASIEQSFARKKREHMQWILSNDRIASMYADILSIHWGKKMSKLLFDECLNFQPATTSNATIQYYDFLGFYLGVPNRLELKLMTDKTLKEIADDEGKTVSLDVFLREFNKRSDNLRFNEEIFNIGEKEYLHFYKDELLGARMDLQIQKIQKLSKEKASYVMLISQPESLTERKMFINRAAKQKFIDWAQNWGGDLIVEDEKRQLDITTQVAAHSVDSDGLGKETAISNAYITQSVSIIDLLARIENKYRGQHIIIDIWVPWMEKCKDDLLSNSAFRKAIDTLPVQMIYLCSSNDVSEQYWLQEVESFPMQGDHLFLSKNLSAEIMELLRLRTYPGYLYISPNGTFDSYFINSLSDFDPKELENSNDRYIGL